MVVEPSQSALTPPSSANSFSHRTSARPPSAGWSQARPVHQGMGPCTATMQGRPPSRHGSRRGWRSAGRGGPWWPDGRGVAIPSAGVGGFERERVGGAPRESSSGALGDGVACGLDRGVGWVPGSRAVAHPQLELDPRSGHMLLFTNKRGNLLKTLFFDRSGLALLCKRLEQETFQLPKVEDGDAFVQALPAFRRRTWRRRSVSAASSSSAPPFLSRTPRTSLPALTLLSPASG